MLTGFVTGFLAAMVGWQINIIGIHRGLERGRSAPLLIGMGATVADLFIISLAFAGSEPLLKQHQLWAIGKWFGIAAILFASFRILFHKTSFVEPVEKKKRSPGRSFITGVIIVASNPGVYVLWFGIISFLTIHFTILHRFPFRLLFLAEFLNYI